MFTGKRPWHPLSDENITFKVHIQKPPVLKPPYPAPNSISVKRCKLIISKIFT
jgi:hypothetical protein